MLQSRAVGAYARGKPENAVLPAAFARRLGVRKSKKKRRGVAAALDRRINYYLETDFLNMRSIFSLIASMAVELACAVDNA
jgi:hypothetical protein